MCNDISLLWLGKRCESEEQSRIHFCFVIVLQSGGNQEVVLPWLAETMIQPAMGSAFWRARVLVYSKMS